MSTKSYLILCLLIAVVWVPVLLLVPAVSDYVEQIMLWFLSTNAT